MLVEDTLSPCRAGRGEWEQNEITLTDGTWEWNWDLICKHRCGENLQAKGGKTALSCLLKEGSYKQRLMQTLLWFQEGLLIGQGRCCRRVSRDTKRATFSWLDGNL